METVVYNFVHCQRVASRHHEQPGSHDTVISRPLTATLWWNLRRWLLIVMLRWTRMLTIAAAAVWPQWQRDLLSLIHI